MTRAAVALALVVVAAGAGFGPRTLLHLRRHGDHGWRAPGTRPGVVAHLLLSAAGILLLAAPTAALTHGAAHEPAGIAWFTRTGTTPAAVSLTVGVLLATAGTLLTLVAQHQMGASWRVGVDPTEHTALVTDGVFAAIRNPIFSGMALCAIGIAVVVPNLLAAGALTLGAAGLQVQVRVVEEPYLRSTHGSRYERWAATAGRFLPHTGRVEVRSDSPPRIQ